MLVRVDSSISRGYPCRGEEAGVVFILVGALPEGLDSLFGMMPGEDRTSTGIQRKPTIGGSGKLPEW